MTRSSLDVHRIELPLPFELEAINLYLVRLESGWLLIDCGMDTPQSFAALQAGLDQIGVAWPDIRLILLTHMHPDHIGLTHRVKELSGASVMMHEAEAEHLDSLEDESRRLPYLHAAYALGGVPTDLQDRMDQHFAFLRKSLHDVTPDRLLRGDEQLPSAIGPLTVIPTPGHSPGHVCLYAAERKMLFSGDHILNSITPNISWHPGTDALGDYMESLEKVGRLDVDEIFPAHGGSDSRGIANGSRIRWRIMRRAVKRLSKRSTAALRRLMRWCASSGNASWSRCMTTSPSSRFWRIWSICSGVGAWLVSRATVLCAGLDAGDAIKIVDSAAQFLGELPHFGFGKRASCHIVGPELIVGSPGAETSPEFIAHAAEVFD